MNWKLIIALSGFGLVMGLATVYVIPTKVEMYVWLLVFAMSAFLVQKFAHKSYFLHGFATSILNCIWMTGCHILLMPAYLLTHPEEATAFGKIQDQYHISTTQTMLFTGLIYGLFSGLFLGFLCNIFGKLIKKMV